MELRHTMEEFTIDEEMIKKTLDNLNVYKSVEPDGIHPRLLKELSNHLCKPLARLFNNSVAVNYQRTGNREGSQPYLRRVIEKRQEIIDQSAQQVQYANVWNNVPKTIFGFIKGRSTVLQLLNLLTHGPKL